MRVFYKIMVNHETVYDGHVGAVPAVGDVITVDEEAKKAVTEGLKLLGVDRVVESGQELRDALADCLSLRSRTELVVNSVYKGPNRWIRIGLLLVVLAGIPLLLPLIKEKPGLEFLQEVFTHAINL